MRISGRDLKKIIKEEIGREMKRHASGETLSKHSSLAEEDNVINEVEIEDKLPRRSDAEIAAAAAKVAAFRAKSLLFRTLDSPEGQALQRWRDEDNARFDAMMADPEFFNSRTASTQPVMDLGTTKITSDEVIDIDDALREGKNEDSIKKSLLLQALKEDRKLREFLGLDQAGVDKIDRDLPAVFSRSLLFQWFRDNDVASALGDTEESMAELQDALDRISGEQLPGGTYSSYRPSSSPLRESLTREPKNITERLMERWFK